MKRATAALIVMMLSLAVVGCSSDSDEDASTTEADGDTCATIADVLDESGTCTTVENMLGQATAETSDGDEYIFSDGTGEITIDINTSSASPDVPLNTDIRITGVVESNGINVSSWTEA